jgi:hypothetical protein
MGLHKLLNIPVYKKHPELWWKILRESLLYHQKCIEILDNISKENWHVLYTVKYGTRSSNFLSLDIKKIISIWLPYCQSEYF